MTKSKSLNLKVKACRPRFKAGSDLSSKVNRVEIIVNETEQLDADRECIDTELNWETEAELADCGQ